MLLTKLRRPGSDWINPIKFFAKLIFICVYIYICFLMGKYYLLLIWIYIMLKFLEIFIAVIIVFFGLESKIVSQVIFHTIIEVQ